MRRTRFVLAAGAMTSPRILQDHLHASGVTLPCGDLVGANFKMHINSAVLGFSPFKDHDVLRKTAVLYNDKFPHSSMQCLGWIDPRAPRRASAAVDCRASSTSSSARGRSASGRPRKIASTPENRIISGGPGRQADHGLQPRPHPARDEGAPCADRRVDRAPARQQVSWASTNIWAWPARRMRSAAW